jgi:branched-chain amino acid transport system permease protein
MTLTLPALMNGMTYGALLFLVASGFTLIFGLLRVVNMSHGAFYLLGAYVGYTVAAWVGGRLGALGPDVARAVGWPLGVLGAAAAVGTLAFLLEMLLKRVPGETPQTLLTLALAIMAGDVCMWIWGGLPLTLRPPTFLRQPVVLFGMPYPGFRLFVLVVAILVGVGLYVLLFRTQLGRIIRAGVDNRRMVSALGINIDRLFTSVFVLGGALTGLSGAIGGSYLAFQPGTDFDILTLALFVVVIGGMGSLTGSAIGALIVGLVDSFGRTYLSELSVFLLGGTVMVILAFRPRGLFGRPS